MKRFFGIFALAAALICSASCERPEGPVEKAPIVIYDGPVALADQGFGMYYGDRDFNSEGVYSIVLSDAVCFRDGFDDPYLDSEGDMLVLEFVSGLLDSDAPVKIPAGVYEVSQTKTEGQRINASASYVKKMVGNVQYQYAMESGKFKVSLTAQGTYNIETEDLVLSRGKDLYEAYYSYSGSIELAEWSKVAAEIQDIKADIVDMPFTDVSAAYYGNLFGYGTGNYVITLSTDGFMEDETGTVPGVALVMNIFSELVSGKKEILLNEGRYTVYPSFNSAEYSMLFGLNMDGMPFGTYLAQVDKKGAQSLEFISGGTVDVTRESVDYQDVYTMKYTFNAPSRKIMGTWRGNLSFVDASEGSDRVILSTLDDDVECDLYRVERGHLQHVETLKTTPLPSIDIADVMQLWLQPRMWTEEEKELPWDERIEAWDPNGDVMILEFVTPFEVNGDIAPVVGKEYKYTIQPNLSMEEQLYQVSVSKMGRPYDDIFYQPNWKDYTYMTGTDARRGFTWDGGFRGNWYLHYIEGTWQNMDETAPAVKGTIKVTRTTDYTAVSGGREAQFSLVWDLYDDTEASYNITGEWSGPITVYNNAADLQ
ncbi:MAG: hypothetical protein IKY48_02400 [Bacteroidales bacterium]|nr:hypothetical protein [Bacteroidales bacterium]